VASRDSSRARRPLPRGSCGDARSKHDPCPSRAPARSCDEVRRSSASRVRANEPRACRVAGDASRAFSLRDHASASAVSRGGRPMGRHGPQSREARRREPSPTAPRCSDVHRRRARQDRDRARQRLRADDPLRRRNRDAAGGVGLRSSARTSTGRQASSTLPVHTWRA
jgi:hypothetical protein